MRAQLYIRGQYATGAAQPAERQRGTSAGEQSMNFSGDITVRM